jgi:hypothetical protein
MPPPLLICRFDKSKWFDFYEMRAQIGLEAQDPNGIQRPKLFFSKYVEVKFLTSTTTPT